MRKLAVEILCEIKDENSNSTNLLNKNTKNNSDLDSKFLREIVYGTLENRIYLDYIIKKLCKLRIKKFNPYILNILRISIYQIIFMDKIPEFAIINEAVNLVKIKRLQGLTGFVNGILRKISSEKEELKFDDLSIRYSMPEFILNIIRDNTGEYFNETLEYFLNTGHLSIRVNTSKSSVEDVIKDLEAKNIKVKRSKLNSDILYITGFDRVDDIEVIKSGKCYITDTSSSMISKVLGVRDIKKCVDVCAAPGGKSFLLADKLDKSSKIYSCDVSENKVELIRENAKVQGFSNIIPAVADARIFDERFFDADLILADLPCSGIGIIGKKPDIKYRLEEEGLKSLSNLQKEILDNVSKYVKKNGELIFST